MNLAARLCDAAYGGEILVSGTVGQHPASAAFRFTDPSALELRGFSDPVVAVGLLDASARA